MFSQCIRGDLSYRMVPMGCLFPNSALGFNGFQLTVTTMVVSTFGFSTGCQEVYIIIILINERSHSVNVGYYNNDLLKALIWSLWKRINGPKV